MSALHIQRYMLDGGNFEELRERFRVNHRRHTRHENLVLFKYGIDAPFAERIPRECRGIVLDESDGWRVVSRAFDKFFNHGEGHADAIDWSTARVQEKLDGSLCVLYWYAGEWHVATTGTPDASGDVNGAGTFRNYFWRTFQSAGGCLPGEQFQDLCFAFELMGPANRIVVVHERPWLRLLAVRNRVTGEEMPPEDGAVLVGIEAVRSFPLGSVGEIMASFEAISPVSQEGYVVVDGAFRRLKIKHPGYVALHHAKDGMGPKAFVQIARTGEQSEVLAAFPEFRPLIEDARTKYTRLVAEVHASYARLKDIPVQKDFALEALKTPYSAALFQMRKGVAAEEFFRDVAIERLMGWMGVAGVEETGS